MQKLVLSIAFGLFLVVDMIFQTIIFKSNKGIILYASTYGLKIYVHLSLFANTIFFNKLYLKVNSSIQKQFRITCSSLLHGIVKFKFYSWRRQPSLKLDLDDQDINIAHPQIFSSDKQFSSNSRTQVKEQLFSSSSKQNSMLNQYQTVYLQDLLYLTYSNSVITNTRL